MHIRRIGLVNRLICLKFEESLNSSFNENRKNPNLAVVACMYNL